jgi:hypothetical protein
MTSIPARLAVGSVSGEKDPEGAEIVKTVEQVQPYVEVKRDDPLYPQAVRDAYYRVSAFQGGPRYRDCEDKERASLDIVDPDIKPGGLIAPAPIKVDNDQYTYQSLKQPDHPHWFVTDTTDPPGDWAPRRSDWKNVLITGDVPLRVGEGEDQVVALVNKLHVTGNQDLKSFSLTDRPMAVWVRKQECKFPASIPPVMDLKEEDLPNWVRRGLAGVDDVNIQKDDHLYSISPGAQLFTTICLNCHGPQADSKSRNADTISDLTGGDTRVANLRDGLFGPTKMPGTNVGRVFANLNVADVTPDDWGARYLSWMALGGTQRLIPKEILQLIGNLGVFGERRSGVHALESGNANMLETAKFLCRDVLPGYGNKYVDIVHGKMLTTGTAPSAHIDAYKGSALVYKNGDGAFWEDLCALQNPLPVRVLTVRQADFTGNPDIGVPVGDLADGRLVIFNLEPQSNVPGTWDLYRRESYGSNAVGDQNGSIRLGLRDYDGNTAPWCVRTPEDVSVKTMLDAYWTKQHGGPRGVPYCPEKLFSKSVTPDGQEVENNRYTDVDVLNWTRRGAMNAGLAVYLYLEALAKGEAEPPLSYNACEKLPK